MKKTLILLLVLALIAGTWFLVTMNTTQGTLDPDEIGFAVPDTAEVMRITITHVVKEAPREKVILERKNGIWMVNGKGAAYRYKINNLLITLLMMRVREPIPEKGRTTALEILNKNHTRVEVYDVNGLLKTILVGSVTKDQLGTIMMLEGAENAYSVERLGHVGNLVTHFSFAENDWRENNIFDIRPEQISLVALNYKGPDSSITLKRNTPSELWTSGSGAIDAQRMTTYLTAFAGKVNAESFASASFPGVQDSLRNLVPDARIHVAGFNGYDRELFLYYRPGNTENMFGWLGQDGELLTIQWFVLRKLLKPASYFHNLPA